MSSVPPTGFPTSPPSPSPSPRPATYWVIYSLAYSGPPDFTAVVFNWAMIAFGGFVLFHSAMLHGLRYKSVRLLTDISASAMILSGLLLHFGKLSHHYVL